MAAFQIHDAWATNTAASLTGLTLSTGIKDDKYDAKYIAGIRAHLEVPSQWTWSGSPAMDLNYNDPKARLTRELKEKKGRDKDKDYHQHLLDVLEKRQEKWEEVVPMEGNGPHQNHSAPCAMCGWSCSKFH